MVCLVLWCVWGRGRGPDERRREPQPPYAVLNGFIYLAWKHNHPNAKGSRPFTAAYEASCPGPPPFSTYPGGRPAAERFAVRWSSYITRP